MRRVIQTGTPVCVVERPGDLRDADVVLADNESGTYDSVTYLISLGHRAIATITSDNLITVVENAPVPRFNTRLALATHACAHAYDHYGQMAEYLRMNGIVPPATSAQPSSSATKH